MECSAEVLFKHNSKRTREQFAAMLYKYAVYKGYDVSIRAEFTQFTDAAMLRRFVETYEQ